MVPTPGHRDQRLVDRGMTVGNLVGESIGACAFFLRCVPLTVMDDFGQQLSKGLKLKAILSFQSDLTKELDIISIGLCKHIISIRTSSP